MKIFFYINSLCHGGAERVICNLASQFADDGNECVLITSFSDECEYALNEKVKRVSLYDKPLKGKISRNIKLVKRIRKYLKEGNPDVIVSFMAEPNFRTIVAARGLSVKTIISVRNDPNKEYPNFIFRFLAKSLYKRADGVVFQTEDAKSWFPKKIQEKSKIIYNQVDDVFFQTRYDGVRRNIVTTGRLVPQKNHELLIRAFALIADKVDDDLYVYGEGELRGKLESLVKELNLEKRVFLPGVIQDVANTIKSAKLFVLSSNYEGMPNALMEAMALGLPCIATDCPCGGARALFGCEMKNCLVGINDEQLLAAKMYEFCNKDDLIERTLVKEKASQFIGGKVFDEWKNFMLSKY